jgi:hypothetical protein
MNSSDQKLQEISLRKSQDDSCYKYLEISICSSLPDMKLIFSVSSLRVLSISNILLLTELPDKFEQLPFLLKFILEKTGVTKIPQSFEKISLNLEMVSIEAHHSKEIMLPKSPEELFSQSCQVKFRGRIFFFEKNYVPEFENRFYSLRKHQEIENIMKNIEDEDF